MTDVRELRSLHVVGCAVLAPQGFPSVRAARRRARVVDDEIGQRHRRVEQRVELLPDRPIPPSHGREVDRLGRQHVAPPARMPPHVEHRARGEGGRHRQPVTHIPQSRPRHRHIDGQHQRLVPRLLSPCHQLFRRSPVPPDIELEPQPRPRHPPHLLGHRLGGRRAESRDGIRDAAFPGHPRDRRLALVVHEPGEAGRREAERHRGRGTEDGRRGRQRADVLQDAGLELDPLVCRPRPPVARLGLRGAVDIVEDGPRDPAADHVAQIGHGERGAEVPTGRGELRSLEFDEVTQLGPTRHLTTSHGPTLPVGRERRQSGPGCAFGGGRRRSRG